MTKSSHTPRDLWEPFSEVSIFRPYPSMRIEEGTRRPGNVRLWREALSFQTEVKSEASKAGVSRTSGATGEPRDKS
jgi:hypothetical protein